MWSMYSFAVALAVVSMVSGSSAPDYSGLTVPLRLHSRQSLPGGGTTDGAVILPVSLSQSKQSYFAVIAVGNISFRVALDTASSDLWLASTACSTKACTSVPRFPLTYHSPTFVSVNNNSTAFNSSYSDGTAASGFVAMETVQLSNLTVPNQVFGVVTNSTVTLGDKISGIFGLGFPRLSIISNVMTSIRVTFKHELEAGSPFFAMLARDGKLDYPLFGLSLTRNTAGTLSIGAIDASVVTNVSSIEWNQVVSFSPIGTERNVSSYLQWAIALSGFSVNGTGISPSPSYPDATRKTSLALLDVGTPGMFGPYQDVSRLYALIGGSRLIDASGQWAVPCDITLEMSFTFGHRNFTLQPSDYLIGPAAGNPNMCLSWPRATPPSFDGIDWQFGTAFLRTVYSIFSYGINAKESPVIGLYPLHSNSAETPPSVSSFFSSESATVATTLPNFPIATPSYTTPPYAFNTSVPAAAGEIVSSELATSTYSPVLGSQQVNSSALPTISPSPSLVTFLITDSAGMVLTSTSTVVQPSVTLGIPPGFNSCTAMDVPYMAMILSISPTIFFAIINIIL